MIRWQAVPFLRFLFFLIPGILLSGRIQVALWPVLISLLFTASLSFLWSIQSLSFRYRFLFGWNLSIFLFLLGILLPKIEHATFSPDHFQYHFTDSKFILAEVKTCKVTKSGNYQQVIISISGLGPGPKDLKQVSGQALCYLPIDFSVHPGSSFIGKGKMQKIPPPGNPGEFNYAAYLALQDVHQQIRFESQSLIIVTRPQLSIHKYLLQLNTLLHQKIIAHFDSRQAGLISALVIGQKSTLEQTTKDSFIKVGAMHVLAVSGMHVGIVAMSLGFLFRYLPFRLRNSRLLKTILNLAGIWFFALLSGSSPSVLRAALMFSFFVIGKQFSRKTNIWNILAASAFLLICLNSKSIFLVGFQLSYLALAGIVFFQPRLHGLIPIRNQLLDYIWQLFCLGIAAQLGTAALSIYYFDQFPKYFWLSGVIIVPLATLALLLGILFLICASIPIVGDCLQRLLNVIVELMLFSMDALAKLPASNWDQLHLDTSSLFLIYVALISLALWMALRMKKLLWLSIFLLACLLFQQYQAHSLRQKQQYFIAYKEKSKIAIELVRGVNSITFLQDSSQLSSLNYNQQNLHTQLGIKQTTAVAAPQNTYRINVSDYQIWYSRQGTSKIPTLQDYFLLVDDQTPDSLWNKVFEPQPKLVILAPTLSVTQAQQWKQQLEKEGISVKNLVEETGFIHAI